GPVLAPIQVPLRRPRTEIHADRRSSRVRSAAETHAGADRNHLVVVRALEDVVVPRFDEQPDPAKTDPEPRAAIESEVIGMRVTGTDHTTGSGEDVDRSVVIAAAANQVRADRTGYER